MLESVIRILFDGASTLAAGLIVYVVLSSLVGFGQWILRRRRPLWLLQME